MKVGYVRISTKEQNTARQDELMESLGVEKVYTDKMSGKDTNRPGLEGMMDFVREGDTVIVESFSRFARNTQDLLYYFLIKSFKKHFIAALHAAAPAARRKSIDNILGGYAAGPLSAAP